MNKSNHHIKNAVLSEQNTGKSEICTMSTRHAKSETNPTLKQTNKIYIKATIFLALIRNYVHICPNRRHEVHYTGA